MARLGRVALLVALVLLVVYGAAWATVDRYGASRAIAWLESDTGDIERFPSRVVPAGTAMTVLPAGEPLDHRDVWPSQDDPERVLDESDSVAFLIVEQGQLRFERYADGASAHELRTSFSVATSIVSTLIGLAIADGAIGSLDDPITDRLPELLERDERFARITLRHLVTMASGLGYRERRHPFSDDAQTYDGTDLRATGLSARIDDEPGQEFHDNNDDPLLEGLILERATGERVSDYLTRRLWQPMGAEADASWSLDSNDSGFEKMESGFNAIPRDDARFGLLVANEGRVGDQEVVPAAWLRLATSPEQSPSATGFDAGHWWTGTPDGRRFPDGHAMAAGNHGQYIYVAPERDLAIVRLGDAEGEVDRPELLASIAGRLSP